MIYSIPYILLIAVYGFLAIYFPSIRDDKTKKGIIILSFGILLIFFGFRGFIGTDWTLYYPGFEDSTFDNVSLNVFSPSNKWHFEPGFTLLMMVCKTIVDSYQFFIFVCCLINCVLLFRFLGRRTDNIPLSIMIFICMGGFGLMTNLMRNSISILLFANALEYLENRRPWPYFTICLVALTMHISSLMYIPLYFFFHRKCNKWVYLGIFIIGNLVLLLHIKTITPIISSIMGSDSKIGEMLEDYTQGDYESMNFKISIGYLERLMTGTLIFCYYNRLIAQRKENILFINGFLAYFSMYFFFSEFTVMSERLAELFVLSYWIIWPDLLKCFAVENNRRLFVAFLTVYCILKINGMTNLDTQRYDNVLFGAQSYQERLYIFNKSTDGKK
jgi:hypothetical protein